MSNLNLLDYAVIALYFGILVAAGFILSRRASKSLEDYFLGGRKLPWWALGMSGTASWFDITGTMLIVSFLYMLGPRGIYIEFRGGACLVLAFMLVFTGKWHRRSGCMTEAEWMVYRFGETPAAQFARLFTALGKILFFAGMLAYMIKGVGAFLAIFFPFLSPMQCSLIMLGIATVYTMASGFYGVVITDVIQTLIILIVVGVITTTAIMHVGDVPDLDEYAERITRRDFIRNDAEAEFAEHMAAPQALEREADAEAASETPGIWTEGREHWSTSKPSWQVPMPPGYKEFGFLITVALFYLARNMLEGLSTGGDQRYFGARNERECGLLSAMWGGLIMVRWPMMIGFAVLGLFLVGEFFGKTDEDRLVWEAQKIVKQDVINEVEPGFELDLESASVLQHRLPPGEWESALQKASESPQDHPELVEDLQLTLGENYLPELKHLVEQHKLLEEHVKRENWGEILADARNDEKTRARLVDLLGEDELDTKMQLISYDGTVAAENILPAVILHRIPIGIRGLLLVALLAASMSTFDSSVNLATSFFTRDVYQRYLRKGARNRELIVASYAFGILLVAIGFVLSTMTKNINQIWGWIIMSLLAGTVVVRTLRLYWWRFNATGVVCSTIVGLIVPLVLWVYYRNAIHEWNQFLIVIGTTGLAAVVGTYLVPPTDRKTLEYFYKTTRPFGWWKPLENSLPAEVQVKVRREHRNDMKAIPFVMITQVTLYMLPMQLVIRAWDDFAVTLPIFLVGLAGTYRFWYRHLPPKREGVPTLAEIEAGQL